MTLARIVSHVSFCTSVIVCPLGFGRRSVCRTVVALPPSDGTHLPLKTPAKVPEVPVSPLPVHVDLLIGTCPSSAFLGT